ncbi:type II toxin-antitoxin system RelE/ParE family toxin [Acidicapsa dinghuensis]|uniref:Type II toxin-antitoxin system RelE/ParE family toxin n=1 Tax=Acidicapsa dinghuensis TaxID=2218256 RepID=A0ABW1EJ37_9BACT
MRITWNRQAIRDLDEIAIYIANDSPQNAALVETRIHRTAIALSEFPLVGRLGRIAGTRERVVGRTPFILIYRVEPDEIRILRVIRGTRKWPKGFA